MGKIIRPDLLRIMGKEHEDTEQLLETLCENRIMAMTMLRRKTFMESFGALGKEDEEIAEYWEQLAGECDRLYEGLWNETLTEDAAWTAMCELLKLPMPERPLSIAQLRTEIESRKDKTVVELIKWVVEALQEDRWRVTFSKKETTKKAYEELKRRYEENDSEEFINGLERACRGDMGEPKESTPDPINDILIEWCLTGAAENLTKKEEDKGNFLLDEVLWEEMYDSKRKEWAADSYLYVASELLRCLDACLEQEPGSIWKGQSNFEKYKKHLEEAEKRHQVLEEAFLRLKGYREQLAGDNWFEGWEREILRSEKCEVFFVLASGLVRDDKTRFDRIWQEEVVNDMEWLKNNGGDDKIYAKQYLNYGNEILERINKGNSNEGYVELGKFWVPEQARESLIYILNGLTASKDLLFFCTRDFGWNASPGSMKEQEERNRSLLKNERNYAEKEQRRMDEITKWERPDNPCPWNLRWKIGTTGIGKKRQYYLTTAGNYLYRNTSVDECYDALRYVVEHHPCRNYNPASGKIISAKRKETWNCYMNLWDSFDEITDLKERCNRFFKYRRKFYGRMSDECDRVEAKIRAIVDAMMTENVKTEYGGMFSQWLQCWEELARLYEGFEQFKSEWRKKDRELWASDVSFCSYYKSYRNKVIKAFEDSYRLLEERK